MATESGDALARMSRAALSAAKAGTDEVLAAVCLKQTERGVA